MNNLSSLLKNPSLQNNKNSNFIIQPLKKSKIYRKETRKERPGI
jgi:hypothetical protein